MSYLGEAALQYVGRGWYVFPLWPIHDGKCTCGNSECDAHGKHPRVKWKTKASKDPSKVAWYWNKWPDAGIGISTGPSGLAVFDVDGMESVRQLQEILGGDKLPPTLRSTTGKGQHLYFKGEVPTSSTKGTGLDVRGGAGIHSDSIGYVVAPPSTHASGRAYQWIKDAPIADCPSKLVAWAKAQREKPTASKANVVLPNYAGGNTLALRGMRAEFGTWGPDNEKKLRSALAAIPASCGRDDWLNVGMALHWIGWPGMFDLWNEWSATCPDKYKPDNTAYVWNSFKIKNLTLRTLFSMANERGWKWPPEKTEQVNNINGVHVLPPEFYEQPNKIVFPDLNKAGQPVATCRNTRVAIRGLGIACEHDTFHDKLRVGGQAVGTWAGDLTDNAVHMLRVAVERVYRFDPGTVHAHDAAIQECLQRGFDPVVDYLNDLTWDGAPRLGTWVVRYLGADGTAFERTAGALALIAAVRRARQPGTKFDQIIVLEGPEGRGKSTALEILASSDNFSDQTILTLDDRGQQEAMLGVWIYEIAEMSGLGRTEIERVKTFASRKVDRARPAYGRSRIDKARRCVFFATTNDRTYLKSQTGNRRFWPIRCGRLDLAALRADRDQIWAEAARLEATGLSLELPESLWPEAAVLQDARRDHDPWEDILEKVEGKLSKDGTQRWIATREILENVLHLPIERQNEVSAKRVAFIMRRHGWDGPKTVRGGESVFKGYTVTARVTK